MAPRRRAERRRPDGAGLGFGVALRVFALPGPGIPAHILQCILCLPAEKLLCFGGISPVFRQIARPAGTNDIGDLPAAGFPERFLTTAIASEMSYASVGSLQRNALFSIGLVLFLFIMLINVFLNVCIKRKKEA